MEAFAGLDNFWDLSQHPSTFSTIPDDDFLTLLQKQFPPTAFDLPPPDGVDPLNIGPLPIPNPTPPSTDSSPSPPSGNQEPESTRRHSGAFSGPQQQLLSDEDPSLKRKADDDSFDDDQSHDSAHDEASRKPASGPQRRKTTGNPHQDESRLLKRKEQNRAAQRAFRERKEKHVKDLEDKVAALETKNQLAESENDNLRDLLSRLQSENMALKQAAFTFTVPKPSNSITSNSFNNPQSPVNGFFSSPGASTSTAPSVVSSPAQYPQMSVPSQQYEYNFGSLIPFDASVLDDTSDAMNMDQPYNQGNTPYKTIASNPMFMSFGEPTPYDLSPPSMAHMSSTPSTESHPTPIDGSRMQSFSDWSQSPPGGQGMESLEQLFGVGYNGAQSPVDITALLRSSPSSVSPVSHASIRSNPGPTPPTSTINAVQQNGNPSLSNPDKIHTREQCQAAIQQAGPSPFVQDSPAAPQRQNSGQFAFSNGGDLQNANEACTRLTAQTLMASMQKQAQSQIPEDHGFVRKTADPSGPMVMCKGSSFPKTEQNDRNIEVLAAWRSITSNPQFKNVDINELCSEFTKKARCDGTKVVIEPEGVSDIMETLAVRRQ